MKSHLLILVLLGLMFQCNPKKKELEQTVKIPLLMAENNYGFGHSTKFQIYIDSTYELKLTETSINYEKIEIFKGFCFIKGDTIFFKPLAFRYTNSEKAVLKNNFIEFIGEDFPFRLKIKKLSPKIKQTINLGQINGYSIFTYNKKFYRYFNHDVKQHEITQNELIQVDKILEKCFTDNRGKLRAKNEGYVKQIIPVINKKNEIEIWINCICKNVHFQNEYEYQIIEVKDGGNCFFRLRINLTKQSYSDFSINGVA